MTDDVVRPDAPNQQLVRPDGSHPADEGSGGGKPPKRAKDATTRASAGESKAKTADTPDKPDAA